MNPTSRKLWSDGDLFVFSFVFFLFLLALALWQTFKRLWFWLPSNIFCALDNAIFCWFRFALFCNFWILFCLYLTKTNIFENISTKIHLKQSWYPLFRLRKKPFSHLNLHFRPLPRFLPFRRFLRQSAKPFSGTKINYKI